MSGRRDKPPAAPAEFQHILMFWLLTAMALALFVPCAILPVAEDWQRWWAHRGVLQSQVDAMEQRIEHQDKIITALRTDPGVNERLMARELGYVAPDEEIVRYADVPPVGLPRWAEPMRPALPLADPPAWMARLPVGAWAGVFVESPTRELMLCMAGGLLVAAFVLYPPRRA